MVGVIETLADVEEGAAWLAAREPRFAEVLAATGPWPLRRKPDGFSALFDAIVSQQVSTAAAQAIAGKLQAAGLWDEAAIAAADEARLRAAGLSRPKARYALSLARAGVDWPALREARDAEVIETLVALPGIGRWTAEIYAMFALGRPDVLAAGDLALQEAARALFGLSARPGEGAVARAGRALVALARGCRPRALGLLPAVEIARGGPLMARKLNFGRKAAVSGAPKSLVIFLHGYGADSADLLSLADVLGPYLPDTTFLAPDAPDPVPGAPSGYQWFPIPRFDGSTEAQALAGFAQAAEDLTLFLRQRAEDEAMPLASCAFVGFSQGAMMALHVAPRLDQTMAAVVSISGRLMLPEDLGAAAICKPPVMLIHGDQDEVVEFDNLGLAGNALTSAGFSTFAHVMKGMGHGISQDGLQVTLDFLVDLPAWLSRHGDIQAECARGSLLTPDRRWPDRPRSRSARRNRPRSWSPRTP